MGISAQLAALALNPPVQYEAFLNAAYLPGEEGQAGLQQSHLLLQASPVLQEGLLFRWKRCVATL